MPNLGLLVVVFLLFVPLFVVLTSGLANLASCPLFFQVQHPRSHLERFDLVITPRHDYYSLTPEGKRQIPFFLRPWVTPREPPGRNVVCIFYNVPLMGVVGK